MEIFVCRFVSKTLPKLEARAEETCVGNKTAGTCQGQTLVERKIA